MPNSNAQVPPYSVFPGDVALAFNAEAPGAAQSSQQFALPSYAGFPENGRTIRWQTAFGSAPSAISVTLQTAMIDSDTQYATIESRDESMDDHWRALQSQTAEPGSHYPARAKPGQSLASGFFQPAPAEVPPDLAQHAAALMGPVAQFLTGAFPALFGGAMANNDTAAGYAMARDQAMGRIGLVWRRMKFFHADVILLAVDCFRKNRPTDVEVTLLGAGAAFESKWIRLADLKGNLFSYPETDEQYPTLWAQQRAVLLQMMSSPDPQIQAILAHPENVAVVKRLIGLEELTIPDEESRTKQYREIAQLVAEKPVVKRDDASGVEMMLPSIVPDEFADNHAIELEVCLRWFSSDAGQVAKIEAPAGYANVRAHALFHRDYLGKQQKAQQ
jgi:hypothetical protein